MKVKWRDEEYLRFEALTVDGEIETYTIQKKNNIWWVIKNNEIIFYHAKLEDCKFWLNHNELSEEVA